MHHGGFEDIRLVGRTGDRGADILGHRAGRRWLIQVKFRKGGNIGPLAVDETLQSAQLYEAHVPTVATNRMFTPEVADQQQKLVASGTPIQLWHRMKLRREWDRLPDSSKALKGPRGYQIHPIERIVGACENPELHAGMLIMATGLGKTFVAAEAIRQYSSRSPDIRHKVLVLAHTNELVYQLERAFWPFLSKHTTTAIWNGNEHGALENSLFTFACIDSVAQTVSQEGRLPSDYDVIVIDEAHHAGAQTYRNVVEFTRAGKPNGPFLLGLTATPWRADESDLKTIFGETLACIDIVEGMKSGYLSNVDYRMHVDNIDWDKLAEIRDLTPRGLNRTLFIQEWDDAVVNTLRRTWSEVTRPRAIVFCGTVDHALTMRDRIKAMGFTRAEAIYSRGPDGRKMNYVERNRALSDFHDGKIGVMCAVDIFNEGVDVPDVNILVFQRVTHSRRIFVQQLGRGLRIAPGKERVVVLDFVSDIRRIAAGLDLKEQLRNASRYVMLGSPVRFVNATGEDPRAESFLREWLRDAAAIQDAGDDDHVLRFPPPFPRE